jgi:hypothetical protein
MAAKTPPLPLTQNLKEGDPATPALGEEEETRWLLLMMLLLLLLLWEMAQYPTGRKEGKVG